MRQFRIPFALLAGLALVFACGTPDQPEQKPEIKIPSESQAIFTSGIQFAQGAGNSMVTFTTTDTWMADVTDTKASSWLSVNPTSGGAGTVNMTVTAQPNTGETARSATVTIKCGTVSKSFSVTQAGTPPLPPEPPSDIPVESVSLSKTELSLNKGQSETLVATVLPDNATDKNVTWSSSNATVASVTQDGRVTALKSGKAVVTAQAGEKSAGCIVTVATPVESVSLDCNSLTLEEGQSATLTATISPNDADDQKVEWSTSDAKVATVDNGKVTAVKEGSATITASVSGKSATCAVTVKNNVVAVTSVTLNKTSLNLIKGQSEVLVATVLPENATDKNVSWSSSDATIASVGQDGKVTALKSGKATITAKAGDKSATCSVTVSTPVESVTLDRTAVSLEVGQTTTLVATISPNDADDKNVTWKSSDVTVATVENGKVTAMKEGSATITASVSGKSATCAVTVKNNVVTVTSVTLNKTELSLTKGQSETLTATVAPANATDKTVTWSSSDATIASVDQNGKVTALKSGSAAITAKAGEKSAICTVTVTTPVESVSLDRNNVTLEVDQTTTLVATIHPNDADEKTVVWTTSNASIATVTGGVVKAVAVGTATITASVGGKSATCTVTVNSNVVPVTSVTLNKTELSLVEGESETLTATVAPANATDKTVTWSSGDATIASVDQNGKVTAMKEGSTTVTAKAGEKSALCTVTVTKPVTFSITPTSVEVEADGGTFTVTVTCGTTYHVDSKPGWVTEVSVNGKVHTFSVPANTSTDERSGVVVFCDDQGTCLPCTVKQNGKEVVPFSITPTSVDVEAGGGTFTVTVTCSTTYHINSKPDWVTEVSVSGKVHTFSVPANPDAQQRSGVIVFCDDQGTCLPCTVKQKAGESTSLEVSPTSLSFDADAGTRTFNITSNQSWTVTSNQSWCQVSPSSGSNNGMVTVSASANGSSDARNATLTVSVPGKSLSRTISVSQAGASSQESFDWSQTFYHRSLMMRFTATWCGWCPRMNKSVRLAQEQNPGKIEALNLHGGGSDLDFSGTNVLMSQYSINGFPTGILDGRRLVENYDTDYTASLIGQYMRETEQSYPISSAMSYTSSWSGQNLSVDVSLYLRYAANYKVTVVLLEDGIINQQSDYEEGNHSAYTHDRIARMAISNISGDAFSTSQNETIKHFSYSVSVPSSYNKSNLKILVYVQREFGSQTVLQSGNYGNYYVDNCASGVAGGSLAPTVVGQASGGNEDFTDGNPINW